ncbi:MAG: ABC transporter ATP-binding protein [Deltaproteobacteria bacterium]|nr:ABC transporter ATP-binding protein [Deltaproteobacteria bacterium]
MLSLTAISKRFGRVQALDAVTLEFPPGEIHAVLGENGAGKSTLMHVLSGLYRPDAGAIYLDRQAVHFRSPVAARRAGIGMVHQHFTLVDALTVAENLALSHPDRPRLRLSAATAVQQATELAGKLGLDIGDPRALTGQLPVGVRQRLEIVKALAGNARILILDEPTAVLTRAEIVQLFGLLRRLRAGGALILFITHKLREVGELADRVTVMRRGRVVATRAVSETSEAEMAVLMIGAPAPPRQACQAPLAPAAGQLRVAGLSTKATDGRALHQVTFAVRAGEIFGIAGVAGNGQQELFEALLGLRPLSAGAVEVNGRRVLLTSPAAAAAGGIGNIPPDRQREGLALTMSVADNALLNCAVLGRVRDGIWLRRRTALAFARDLVERQAVQTDALTTPVASLSGGNQQRLIVGRQLAAQPEVLLAVDPTRGLDIAAAQAVYAALAAFVAGGRAVVLISSDLDEVLDLSHRFAVLYGGRLSAALAPPVTAEAIGRLMAGAEPCAS